MPLLDLICESLAEDYNANEAWITLSLPSASAAENHSILATL